MEKKQKKTKKRLITGGEGYFPLLVLYKPPKTSPKQSRTPPEIPLQNSLKKSLNRLFIDPGVYVLCEFPTICVQNKSYLENSDLNKSNQKTPSKNNLRLLPNTFQNCVKKHLTSPRILQHLTQKSPTNPPNPTLTYPKFEGCVHYNPVKSRGFI